MPGGGGSKAPPPLNSNDVAYLERNPDVAAEPLYSSRPAQHYADYGAGEGRLWGPTPEDPGAGTDQSNPWDNFSFDFSFPEIPQGPSYDIDAINAANLRNSRYAEISSLWGNRLSAASAASTEVNSQIQREESNAALRGVDYSYTAEDKTNRINNFFGGLWSEGQESQLSGLVEQYGNPEQSDAKRRAIESGGGYDWAYDVVRGTGESSKGGALPEPVGVGGKFRRKTIGTALTDEDTLGGRKSALGGI